MSGYKLFSRIKNILSSAYPASADSLARAILETAAKNSGVYDWRVDSENQALVDMAVALAKLAAKGFPLAYIEGKVEFLDLELKVVPGVFIPRPETETFVEFAVSRIRETAGNSRLRILDIGTGTGAIALAVAKMIPSAEVVGIDLNTRAIELSVQNALRNSIKNADFKQVDFYKLEMPEEEKFDVVLSNPPYVGEFEKILLPGSVKDFEPEEALFGGYTGTEFYIAFFKNPRRVLREKGQFFFEIGYNQQKEVQRIAETHGYRVYFEKDLSGIERIVWGQL